MVKPIFLFCCLIAIYPAFSQTQTSEARKKLPVLQPEPQHELSQKLVADIISNYTFGKKPVNDKFSSQVFDRFLSILDKGHLYFLKSDIESFEKYRYVFDDSLKNGSSYLGYIIYNTYLQRLEERLNYVDAILKDTFDFNQKAYYQYDRELNTWFEDIEEQNRHWYSRLKYEGLSMKLAGKNGIEIVDVLRKRYDNFYKQVSKSKNEDGFSAFMNAYTLCIDPHTDYFSPRAADDFKVTMAQALEGIGATLTLDGDFTKIRELVKGGPADRSKKLFAGDRIVAVGQGKDGELVDVIGWRLDDVVGLIRGKKDSWVRLSVLQAKASPGDPAVNIYIQRDKIKLEEARAKGEMKYGKNGKKKFKVGYITLPLFYQGTSEDVRRLTDSLKKEGMESLIIDLRGNTGGDLQEAIRLTGLFIKTGPVVQVKNVFNVVEVNSDEYEFISWEGPLAVLVNRESASASEIFSAAIQDYGRGVIIGDRTFGKGTVQRFMDLNQIQQSRYKMGQVKTTIAKFYRINGGSTQHRGVLPDISFPTLYDTSETGESSEPYALTYDEIAPAPYQYNMEFGNLLIKLHSLHEGRMKQNPEFQYLQDDVNELNRQRDEKLLPIQEEEARFRQKEKENKNLERTNERRKLRGLTPLKVGENDDTPQPDVVLNATLDILLDWYKSLHGENISKP